MPVNLEVTVVSPDREVWQGTATSVVAKTTDGEIGIMAGHEPFLGLLASGEVRISAEDGARIVVNAEGGFVSFENDHVTVVADDAALT